MGNSISRQSRSRSSTQSRERHRRFERPDAPNQPSSSSAPLPHSRQVDPQIDPARNRQPPRKPSKLKRLSRSFTRSSFTTASRDPQDAIQHSSVPEADEDARLPHQARVKEPATADVAPTSSPHHPPNAQAAPQTSSISKTQPSQTDSVPGVSPNVGIHQDDAASPPLAGTLDSVVDDEPEEAVLSQSLATPNNPQTDTAAAASVSGESLREESEAINDALPAASTELSETASIASHSATSARTTTPPSEARSDTSRRTNATVPARRVMVQGTIGSAGPEQQQPQSPPTTPPPAQDQTNPHQHSTREPGHGMFNPAAQAVVVARLLSAASAATAASLLPGSIQVGGQIINAFPGLGDSPDSSPEAPATVGHGHPPAPRSSSPMPRTRTTDEHPDRLDASESSHAPDTLSRVDSSDVWSSSPPGTPTSRSRSSSAPELRERLSSRGRSGRANPEDSRATTTPFHSPTQTTSESTPSSPLQRGALTVSRPSLYDQPMPQANAPEGSFERFLSDLQTEVSLAILRDHFAAPRQTQRGDNTSVSSEREPFSFFRSFRFPERIMDERGNLTEVPASEDTEPSSPVRVASAAPGDNASPPTSEEPSAAGLGRSQSTSRVNQATNTGALTSRVAPLLLVGVRSVTPMAEGVTSPRADEETEAGLMDPFSFMPEFAGQRRQQARSPLQEGERMYPSRSVNGISEDREDRGPATQEEAEPLLSNSGHESPFHAGREELGTESTVITSPSFPRPTASTPQTPEELLSRHPLQLSPRSTDWPSDREIERDQRPTPPWRSHDHIFGPELHSASPEVDHQDAQSASVGANDNTPQSQPGPADRTQRRRRRDFVIWIAGGIYPASHPLLLFSDLENADYNDLIRLAEVIGNVKRTTATQAEVDHSGLKIFSVQELPELLERDEVLSNTAERCLVCLEEYRDAPDAELRLLGCRHAFHRDCVDTWLLKSKNSCPCCRAQAVKSLPEEEAPATASGSPPPTSDGASGEDPLDQLAHAMQSQSLA